MRKIISSGSNYLWEQRGTGHSSTQACQPQKTAGGKARLC